MADTETDKEQEIYYHAPFAGNPHKKGVINLTDAPDLPIAVRASTSLCERR